LRQPLVGRQRRRSVFVPEPFQQRQREQHDDRGAGEIAPTNAREQLQQSSHA
jgi:hypothetical protein